MLIKRNHILLQGAVLFSIHAAIAQGINFETALTWDQVKAKAQKEQKYIFLDCYATWCGPCKQMDKEVYPSQKVGNFFNEKYISVKVQFDSTKNDDETVRKWYTIAAQLQQQYHIKALPTYLFCTPDGKVINKGLGYKMEKDLIELAANSLDPAKQYYTQIETYRSGIKNYPSLAWLANEAQYFGNKALADTIARDYINNYLMKLRDERLYTKDNLTFIAFHMSAKDKYFSIFYNNRDRIDSVVEKKFFAQEVIDAYILNEYIVPYMQKADSMHSSDIPWEAIEAKLIKNYGRKDAKRNILDAKIKWYPNKKNWPMFCKSIIDRMHHRDESVKPSLNQYAWWISQYSNSQKQLETALNWADEAIQISNNNGLTPNYTDTKAVLLYKLNRKTEALTTEQKAIDMASEQRNEYYINEFTNHLSKISKAEPIWEVPLNIVE